eukprot:m.66040 g.66040  ORF g.66040 m.66040 type:complete len:325 (+) comp7371_c0_seq2:203-1177(+)
MARLVVVAGGGIVHLGRVWADARSLGRLRGLRQRIERVVQRQGVSGDLCAGVIVANSRLARRDKKSCRRDHGHGCSEHRPDALLQVGRQDRRRAGEGWVAVDVRGHAVDALEQGLGEHHALGAIAWGRPAHELLDGKDQHGGDRAQRLAASLELLLGGDVGAAVAGKRALVAEDLKMCCDYGAGGHRVGGRCGRPGEHVDRELDGKATPCEGIMINHTRSCLGASGVVLSHQEGSLSGRLGKNSDSFRKLAQQLAHALHLLLLHAALDAANDDGDALGLADKRVTAAAEWLLAQRPVALSQQERLRSHLDDPASVTADGRRVEC